MVSYVLVATIRGARSVRELTDELTQRQLRSIPLFTAFSSADLDWIATRSTEQRVAVGDLVVRGGTVANEVLIVLDGYGGAEVDGQAAVVLGPGAVIGGAEALDGALQPMTVIAQTPMVLRLFSASDFRDLVGRVPAFAIALIRQLGGRTRTVLDELVCARQGSVTSHAGSPTSASAWRSKRPARPPRE